MRIQVTPALLVMIFAATLAAQETTTTTASEPKKDSALVTASKKSKATKKSTTKVITNADVKKSKGKIVVLPPKAKIAGEETTVKARDPHKLDRVAVGDLVEITYTEGIAVSVETPQK